MVAVAVLAGIGIRMAGLPHTTPDATEYLLPWYEAVRARGVHALADPFTNYAPFYSYLLLAASLFDGLLSPLSLIKSISFAFEFGCALVAARLTYLLDHSPQRAALAFSLVWLAPSVLHNGALWGQAESIWTFFVLLALLALCERRSILAALAFGVAISVKAQAAFLAPVLLGAVLAGRMRWRDLLLVPATYLALAMPTVVAGRPLIGVLLVYAQQAGTFHALSMNAANPWIFVPASLYAPGVVAGLGLASVLGLGLACMLGRARSWTTPPILLAGAASLILMPFVLPKMHERYFYAFEIVLLVLAVARPVLAPAALLAQASSTLAYLPFDGLSSLGLPLAALSNALLLALTLLRSRDAVSGRANPFRPLKNWLLLVQALWIAYAVQIVLLLTLSPRPEALWPAAFHDVRGFGAFCGILAAVCLVAFSRPAASATPPLPGG